MLERGPGLQVWNTPGAAADSHAAGSGGWRARTSLGRGGSWLNGRCELCRIRPFQDGCVGAGWAGGREMDRERERPSTVSPRPTSRANRTRQMSQAVVMGMSGNICLAQIIIRYRRTLHEEPLAEHANTRCGRRWRAAVGYPGLFRTSFAMPEGLRFHRRRASVTGDRWTFR